jgi:hypothetical protein
MANRRDKQQHQQQSDLGKGTFDQGDREHKDVRPEHEQDISEKNAGGELDRDNEKNLDMNRRE